MVALIVMMPLLCLYAGMMGILGGSWWERACLILARPSTSADQEAVTMTHLWIGLFIAQCSGCFGPGRMLRGYSGDGASAVGEATTSAVVTSIVAIVVAAVIVRMLRCWGYKAPPERNR
jgi:phospholipid/cholesterol/gamma-HCH transport system permease protein